MKRTRTRFALSCCFPSTDGGQLMLLFLVWRFEKDSLWKDENIASSFDTSSLSLSLEPLTLNQWRKAFFWSLCIQIFEAVERGRDKTKRTCLRYQNRCHRPVLIAIIVGASEKSVTVRNTRPVHMALLKEIVMHVLRCFQ